MTGVPSEPDPVEIAREAGVEISIAEALEAAASPPDQPDQVLATAELGYYEAELTSLGGAAIELDEAEHSP